MSDYIDRLVASPTFCEEAISNAACAILTAHRQKDHLPAVLDDVIEEWARTVIQSAIDTYPSPLSERERCEEMVSRYTRYDVKAVAA